jgi:hypothetical protein
LLPLIDNTLYTEMFSGEHKYEQGISVRPRRMCCVLHRHVIDIRKRRKRCGYVRVMWCALVTVLVFRDISFSVVRLKRKVLKFGMCLNNSTNKNR